jgi:hypothetical protein
MTRRQGPDVTPLRPLYPAPLAMRRTLPLLIGVAFALGACAGDEDAPERAATTETTPPAKTEPSVTAYRRALNKLCREDKRAAEDFGEPATADQLTSYLRRTLAYSRKREPLYRALEPPAKLRSGHRRSLELGDEIEAAFAGALREIDAGGDPIGVFAKTLPELADAVEEGNRISRRAGTKDCVVDIPAPGAQSPQDPA